MLGVFPSVGSFANIDFAQNADFQNNKATRDNVRSVRVTALTATIKSPTTADFKFLDSLELKASAPNQEPVLFAKKEGIPQAATAPPNATLTFDVLDVDLGPQVRAERTTLAVSGKGRQPPNDTTIEFKVTLQVGVSPF